MIYNTGIHESQLTAQEAEDCLLDAVGVHVPVISVDDVLSFDIDGETHLLLTLKLGQNDYRNELLSYLFFSIVTTGIYRCDGY